MTYLKQPLENTKLPLKNRLVMPPMATAKSEADGNINQGILDYYDEKTKGGYLSLVIIEHSYVMREGKASEKQVSVAEDSVVDSLKRLSDLIHKNGCKTVMQINHAGSAAVKEVTGMDPVGPSAVSNPSKENAVVPASLDENGIKSIVSAFRDAAVRVKKAGFDGVEIHSAHGYLLNQFLSPLTNKRTDDYGGDITGRIKIHLEIISAIREAAGDFPILLRMGATDYREGGLTVEDSQKAAAAFEQAGVDMLDISGGMCRFALPGVQEPGYFAPYSAAVKEAVSIPVLVTGGITKASEAEAVLRDKKADLIGVGRAIYKDSAWAKNAMESLE
ncbi:NADH:flavin oxidoreductase [Desulfosporosinus acidiphilus SJ4]|uniref:NADH:flavin oxidoreductase n=1 Tax=Desulfosporosinus acidiphilus (strain DSM 22704 / JCM 16185 / SJ4) TaxID=646529 RepID=I4D0Z7_DESAJ|nr:NADH:flavin oxidoreductase [Desulfosporosinus acidiphilus]AFM39471.1 NADH:flavin oxidoreductase [Desulfosporosinus acidiphilus SJ4]